ncbi:hypothetical protein MUN81_05285 [Hymenobacter sp. 5317J-9]|uniref:hypothetical protein n=1 Tax=Hymenobacter sp. 5317J-9 TaxID=2932250 RepID=UPI001FD6390D|nr:hypothetical protein [Hymenobacter sp. 5317J-9]UOQ98903.1 hypothetical protein MUN81_05285 [Hymenobacter sp. 5317J-9]
MRITFTRLALALALAGPWALQSARAQTTYVPATVTGFNADVIANGSGAVANSTTASVDRGNATVKWCFANTSFVSPSGIALANGPALPVNGLITSVSTPNLTFQLAPATGNNSLRIDGIGTGTLTLANPQPCTEVMVLATEGNGSSATKTYTLTFTDGTSQAAFSSPLPGTGLVAPRRPFWWAAGWAMSTTAWTFKSPIRAFTKCGCRCSRATTASRCNA